MGRLFVIRHGQTELNAQNILQGPRIDAALSEMGRRQADSLRAALPNVDVVFCSPLLRARQTAEALLAGREGQVPMQLAPEIYEMDYGEFSGQPHDAIGDQLEQVFDAWRLGFVDQSMPGGESAVLAQHRVRPFAERAYARARNENVAVVAHGWINRVLLATWLGAGLDTLDRFPQDNAAITELDVGDVTTVVRLNDTSHLDLR